MQNTKPDKERLSTQRARVLTRLLQGSATSEELNRICYRYSARIYELRKLGYEITKAKTGHVYTYHLVTRGGPF